MAQIFGCGRFSGGGGFSSKEILSFARGNYSCLRAKVLSMRKLGRNHLVFNDPPDRASGRFHMRPECSMRIVYNGNCKREFIIRRFKGMHGEKYFAIGMPGNEKDHTFIALNENMPVVIGSGSLEAERMAKELGHAFPVVSFAVTYEGDNVFMIESMDGVGIDVIVELKKPQLLSDDDIKNIVRANASILQMIMYSEEWKHLSIKIDYDLGNIYLLPIRFSTTGKFIASGEMASTDESYFEADFCIMAGKILRPVIRLGINPYKYIPGKLCDMMAISIDLYNKYCSLLQGYSVN